MHSLTIQTKYKFGDRVSFDSQSQSCRGVGVIFGVCLDINGHLDYMIEYDSIAGPIIQPGILEREISGLLDA
jgi:hypothetical protein